METRKLGSFVIQKMKVGTYDKDGNMLQVGDIVYQWLPSVGLFRKARIKEIVSNSSVKLEMSENYDLTVSSAKVCLNKRR